MANIRSIPEAVEPAPLSRKRPVAVEARHIELSYGRTAVLQDISLRIEPGEFFALLGPSGSGKSTLLRLIAGFARQQSGQLLIDGLDVGALPPWDRDVGMVFQNYALWPHMTVSENVAFGLEGRKVDGRRLDRTTIRERVASALAMVDLSGFGDRRPGQLSGGQQQRVAIARTLAIEPRVLLLDEPLSNLDARLRVQTRHELVSLQRRLGLTTLFVTHDQEEALTTCHRIAVMDQGLIQQIGSPQELFDQPANRFVARFVGSVNLFTGRLQRVGVTPFFDGPLGRIELPVGLALPSAAGAEVDLAFRPHAVTLESLPAGGRAGSGQGLLLEGQIGAIEFLGEAERYQVRVGGEQVVADVPHRRGQPLLPIGSRVRLGVPAGELRLMTAP